MSSIGKRIEDLRKSMGLSQDDLAAELEVSRQTVYRWEASLRLPNSKQISLLCKVFNVSSDYFLSENENELSAISQSGEAKQKKDNVKNKEKSYLLKKKPHLVPVIIVGICAVLSVIIFISVWFTRYTEYLFLSFIFLEVSALGSYVIYCISKYRENSEGRSDKNKYVVKPLFMFIVCFVVDTMLNIIFRGFSYFEHMLFLIISMEISIYIGVIVYEVAMLKEKKANKDKSEVKQSEQGKQAEEIEL